LAFGFAMPYLIFSYLPHMAKVLPRPGAWMETFKQIMGFFVFGTVIWLVWILSLETISTAVIPLLVVFFLIGMSAWILNRWSPHRGAAMVAGVFAILPLAYMIWQTPPLGGSFSQLQVESPMKSGDGLSWEKFSPKKLEEYRQKGHPVFIDFTAAWCVSCQVNELLVFRSEGVKKKLKEKGVVLLKADWTTQDPVITKMLASFGRSGVPFYVLYGKDKDAPAILLPEVINAGIVLKALDKI
jgi:thiol:disulfide interchange protein DsbD